MREGGGGVQGSLRSMSAEDLPIEARERIGDNVMRVRDVLCRNMKVMVSS